MEITMEKKLLKSALFGYSKTSVCDCMRRKLTTALISCLIFLMLPLSVSASVHTVAEPTVGNTVYIAGNPDLYPIEYYDEQNRLAKNNQVDIISAHKKDEVSNLSHRILLLSYEKNGETCEICVGFTSITDERMAALVKEQIQTVPDSRLLELALQVSEKPNHSPFLWWLAGAVLLLAATVVTLTILMVRIRIKAKRSQQDKFIDSLTGIGNTQHFQQNFSLFISPASYSLYYIVYIAIDIQRIEAYLGAAEAIEIQKFAANVLSTAISDTEFTARMNDGIFLYALQSPSEEDAGTRITELLERLNSFDKKILEEYHILYRAGVFHLNAANIPFETVLLNSRQGYNHAVQNKLPMAFADTKMLNLEAKKAKLKRKFADALKNNEFRFYLQFIVDTKTRQIVGAEALSRWQNPENGILLPDQYIDAMSTAGIIHHLDFYILEEVCRQLEAWSATQKDSFWLSCNITRTTASREDFSQRIKAIVNKYSFAHDRLIIELTEDFLADNQTMAFQNVLTCKNLGFKIALDDLGSGYSSFSDLCDYPLDLIKIDRHIVAKSLTQRGDALLCGIIKLAHDLGIKVLCEGVESEAENINAINAGCDFIQGYYYSHVLPREETDNSCEKYREGMR